MSLSRVWRSFEQRFLGWCPRAILAAALLGAAGVYGPGLLVAQQDPAGKPEKKAAKPDGDEIPAAEDVTLTTGDGLGLALTYFAGTRGKDSIPVILLHAFKGSRKDFVKEGGLAPYLQEKLGCAVVAPDLRGHGESTSFSSAGKSGKEPEPLSAGKLQPRQFQLMIGQDLQAVKEFLWKKNNAEQLNLDKLCVVGVGMGASVALDFALYDALGYEQRVPAYGPLKLGRFLKAMVLVSPEWSFRGLNTRLALASPDVQKNISVMILVGARSKDSEGNVDREAVKAIDDARRFNDFFAKFHPEPEVDKDKEVDKRDLRTLWYGRLDTTLQGTKLLDAPLKTPPPQLIGQFLYFRMVKNPEAKKIPWKERKLPHQ
jgi:pimeloyl-ACP methyl ester carboxylesterase